jgi:putative ABC transport system permease protein
VRQPGRTGLGVLGVAAVGALLFDMLLLSQGLVTSFRNLLDRAGFDARVLASDTGAFAGPPIEDADAARRIIAGLPGVGAVAPVSFRPAERLDDASPRRRDQVRVVGADPLAPPMWTLLDGRDPEPGEGVPPLVVSQNAASAWHVSIGSTVSLRGTCEGAAPPPASFTVVGIAEFPFDSPDADTVAGRLADVRQLCDEAGSGVDMFLVRAAPGADPEAAARAIRAALPHLYVVTNDELVERFSRVEFSYFRQMSFVLATVTLFFGFLLIAVLLTASVNQRLGEIAALRALGLSRGRVVAGVLCESVLVVGAGAVLAVPIGLALSVWLDGILRSLPGIPASVHFFVFQPRALVAYGLLLSAASLAAAAYPMRIVAALPIAGTLREEVVG